MAAQQFHLDQEDRTFLYILYIDKVCAADGAEMEPAEVVCRWYIDEENDCSEKFFFDGTNPASPRYCCFMVASFADVNNRSGKSATVTLSVGDEHRAVAFLDLGTFSTEETFKDATVELLTASGVLGTVELHTAAQRRWSSVAEVVPQENVYFVQPSADDQAQYLYSHIVQEVGGDAAATEADDTGQKQADEEEAKKEAEAAQKAAANKLEQEREQREREAQDRIRREEEEDRRRKEEDKEKSRQKEAEAREKDLQKERDDQLRREEDQRRRDQEDRDRERWRREESEKANDRPERERDTHRRDEDDRFRDRGGDRNHDSPRHAPEDRRPSSRWAEEDRRRQEEEDRWRKTQRERDEDLRERQRREEAERWQESRTGDRRKLEEERERLRQDAKRERAREAAERERRAHERARHADVVAARLVEEGGVAASDSMSSRAPTPGALTQFSRANTPGHLTPAAESHGVGSHGITPKRSGRGPGAASASAGTPPQRSPHTTHFAHVAVEHEEPVMEHRALSQERRPHTEHPARGQPHSAPQTRPAPEQRRTGNPQPVATSRLSPRGFHSSAVPELSQFDAGYESEASEPNPFEGDALDMDDPQAYHHPNPYAAPAPAPAPAPAARKMRTVAARSANTNTQSPNRSRMAGQSWQVAARLENLKASAKGAGSHAGLWTTADAEEEFGQESPRAEGAARHSVAGVHAMHSSPRSHQRFGSGFSHAGHDKMGSRARTTEAATQTASTLAGTPAARSVLAAAFNDAAASEGGDLDRGPRGSAPVAAVEEGLLRLLVLQKQLHVDKEPDGPSAALADAAAGLVPRMMQVLEVARGVCEANRAKLTDFCQDRDMDLEKLGSEAPGAYLQQQLSALDKLHGQYASLLPSPNTGRPPTLPFEDNFYSGHPYGGQERMHTFQPGSRTATPSRMVGGGMGAPWAEFTGLGRSASHGHLMPSSPLSLARTQSSPRLTASSSGPGLADPPSAMRAAAPLDPGGKRPSVPSLQGGSGGSSPPTAKFRELRGVAGSPPVSAAHNSPSLPLSHSSSGFGLPDPSVRRSELGPVETAVAANSMWNATAGALGVAASPNDLAGDSGTSTPRRGDQGRTELPLRLVSLQQQQGTKEIGLAPTRRASSRQHSATRSTAGGAHAAAGSPSPERGPESAPAKARTLSRGRGTEHGAVRGQLADERPSGPGRLLAGPSEDKYFKILQNLQAKGAVGARGKLLDSAGLRDRRENRLSEGASFRDRREALGDSSILSRLESARPWTPVSRSSPATASSKPSHRRRLAADSESDDSVE